MRRLLTPRWVLAHTVVAAIGVSCVMLGFWQLDRLDTVRQQNTVHGSRYDQPPLPIEDMVAQAAPDIASLEYRRATATGTFQPEQEVLVRSQVLDGRAGFHVVTPLRSSDTTVVVNRGWVPLEFDSVPLTAAPPPPGEVTVSGVVRLSRQQGALGQDDSADGPVGVVSRIDLDLLEGQVTGDLLPVYLEMVGESGPTDLPIVAGPPDLGDEGPHLNYAIQWFSFALVGAVGYGFLLRRALRK